MKKIAWGKLIASIALCETVGGIGGIATVGAIPTWYSTLAKPSVTPPGWVFGPVWSTLYVFMGISLYRIWKKGFRGDDRKKALFAFIIQLALNLSWPLVFFGSHAIALGLFVILVLWGMIGVTIVTFYPIDRLASYLLAPYLLWVSFAAYLNYGVWVLHR